METSKLDLPVATRLLLFITEIYNYNYSGNFVSEFVLTIPIIIRSYFGLFRKRRVDVGFYNWM